MGPTSGSIAAQTLQRETGKHAEINIDIINLCVMSEPARASFDQGRAEPAIRSENTADCQRCAERQRQAARTMGIHLIYVKQWIYPGIKTNDSIACAFGPRNNKLESVTLAPCELMLCFYDTYSYFLSFGNTVDFNTHQQFKD